MITLLSSQELVGLRSSNDRFFRSTYWQERFREDTVSGVRLDRLLSKWGQWPQRESRARIARSLVTIDGQVTTDPQDQVTRFSRVCIGDEVVQSEAARYIMLHKPVGVVSATRDTEHRTVVDLIDEEWASSLHLAGRLDRFTTGLVILTNDSEFSESLTTPGRRIGKRYRVTLDQPVPDPVQQEIRQGMWFAKEQVMTAPALLEPLGSLAFLLTIYEGKHHQVKRMFSRFGIKVTALHREAIGGIEMDSDLLPGHWRELTPKASRH